MPRRERQMQRQAIVAAAKNLSFRKSSKKATASRSRVGEEWQHAAWEFFDTVPEYHQGCAITGALLSRARLLPLERTVNEKGKTVWSETKNPVVIDALNQLAGGAEGQGEMLRNLGIHFSVAGGAYLVGPQTNDMNVMMDPDNWLIVASTEFRKTDSGQHYVNGKLMEDVWAIELWKRHPRDHRKYDSPTRAILPVLSELIQLTKRAAAQIDSRLTGNGLFMFSSETEFPTIQTTQNPGDPESMTSYSNNAQGLIDQLQDVGQRSIDDHADASAQLPVFATAPGDSLGKAQHYKFWSDLDAAMPALRLELIRRIALGMDMPPEVLLGNAGSNHWNAWLSDENSVKIHAEPLLRVITSSLTSGYLRRALEGLVDDVNDFIIGADTTQMRMRPNRSKESIELYKLGELSATTMRGENGFEESDAPDDDERRRMLLWRVASGSTTPEIVDAALKEEGVDLGVEITDIRRPAEARPLPSTAEHPVRELPERTEPRAAANLRDARFTALVYASEQMVDRALQRAGNRIKTKYGMRNSTTPANRLHLETLIRAEDCDELLTDAWGCTETTADLITPGALARALDFYTRSVLIGQREPSRASLAAALNMLVGDKVA